MEIQATRQVIMASRANPDLVEKIYTASSAGVLRQVIREKKVGKIIVHPAFEHRLLHNKGGAYKEYIESITALFKNEEDGRNTLAIYESAKDISYAREVFAKYGAILEPEHWIINEKGRLDGEGSAGAVEIVRALVKNTSAFVIGGLMLDVCVKNAIFDLMQILDKIDELEFPRTINKLIAKSSHEIAYSFHMKE